MKLLHIIISIFLLSLLGCQKQVENAKNNPVKPLKQYQNWESKGENGWEKIRQVEYSYNSANLLVDETAKMIQGDTMTPQFRLLRTYGDEDNIARVERERWINDNWIFAMRSAYIYNNGRVIQRIDSVAGSNAAVTFVSYRYDEKDRLETELGLRSVEGNMVNQSKVIYQYDERDLPIEKEFPTWSGGAWTNSRKMNLIYNDAEHHIQTIRYNWVNEQWVENINYKLEVDSVGTRLAELWQRPGENGLEEFMRITYTHIDK